MEKTFNKAVFFPEDFENVRGLLFGADETVILDGEYEFYEFYYHPQLNRTYKFTIVDQTFENSVGTIKTLADLKHFKNLESLDLIYHADVDLETLPVLPRLNSLAVILGKADNLKFLNQFEDLARLDLCLVFEPDLEPIRELTKLRNLALMYIPFTSLDFLENKPDLIALTITDAPVEDFSEVASLTNLQSAYIEMTKLKDVSPFMELENLTSLLLDLNEIDAEGIRLLQELQEGYALEGKELYIDLLD